MYYSFKNINDKWLTNPEPEYNKKDAGYPFNGEKSNLISSFAFVDRVMNPIGDTIIDCNILVDLLNDPNATIYTVLSQLLSLNGFEFFPLQNFMSYEADDWENSFRIDTSGRCDNLATFVCMYIGGNSSYPTGVGNDFVDDGVGDISTLTELQGEKCDDGLITNEKDLQEQKNTNFPYRQVRAFKVRYAEQNQSMFTNIKIDSKEYPETNESIQILSKLAGDNKSQTVSKSQNLYNLYENRSYKATVSGLGNAMIQPTQYFQLENIPLFNGAYIILDVEHNITANKMMTTFSGTKILRYPIPRVVNPSAIFGIQTGDSENTSIDQAYGDITMGVGTAGNPEQAKYNSMYTLKIQ
jgi:hypothetical protein